VQLFLGGGGNAVTARPSASTSYGITGGGFFSIGTDSIVVDVTGVDGVQYNADFFGWNANYTFANRRSIGLVYVEQHAETIRTGTVAARHVFYNNSAFDGRDPAAAASDDGAIATGKAALLPGQTAAFANVTSYDKGINGIMVDVTGLPAGATPTADDFEVSGGGTPPASVSVRRGAGVNGSDRVTLLWRDYNPAGAAAPAQAVANGWLTVTVKANENTGLAAPDVFSFGNLIGETGDGGLSWRVSALDLGAVKRALNSSAAVNSTADPNRDGRVNALDLGILKRNLNRPLPSFTVPSAVAQATPIAPVALFADDEISTGRREADNVLV